MEQQRLQEIVQFARQVQKEYGIIYALKAKRGDMIAYLIDICRKCRNDKCFENNTCEVKKAYQLVVQL